MLENLNCKELKVLNAIKDNVEYDESEETFTTYKMQVYGYLFGTLLNFDKMKSLEKTLDQLQEKSIIDLYIDEYDKAVIELLKYKPKIIEAPELTEKEFDELPHDMKFQEVSYLRKCKLISSFYIADIMDLLPREWNIKLYKNEWVIRDEYCNITNKLAEEIKCKLNRLNVLYKYINAEKNNKLKYKN